MQESDQNLGKKITGALSAISYSKLKIESAKSTPYKMTDQNYGPRHTMIFTIQEILEQPISEFFKDAELKNPTEEGELLLLGISEKIKTPLNIPNQLQCGVNLKRLRNPETNTFFCGLEIKLYAPNNNPTAEVNILEVTRLLETLQGRQENITTLNSMYYSKPFDDDSPSPQL